MYKITIQLNHPSGEKPFCIENGYIELNNQIIRIWNDDEKHYRKFICQEGWYINDIKCSPQISKLSFWGEWEGYSFFYKINEAQGSPNGVHVPFYSTPILNGQNTDPYVFGDNFKYAVCSQTGVMRKLSNGSVILFGTTTKEGFLLDTVFVVKQHINLCDIKNIDYSQIYQETTLERLNKYTISTNKLYESQTWWDCRDFFSFVPCHLDKADFRKRALLSFSWFSKQRVGHPYNHFNNKQPEEIWFDVVQEVLRQGFSLGVRFIEPEKADFVLISQNESVTPSRCG